MIKIIKNSLLYMQTKRIESTHENAATNTTLRGLTPLMQACESDCIEKVALLLEQQPNLMDVDSEGNSVLMYVRSLQVCELVIEKAKARKILNKLLSIKNRLEVSAIDHLEKFNRDICNYLIHIEEKSLQTLANDGTELEIILFINRLEKTYGKHRIPLFINALYDSANNEKYSYLYFLVVKNYRDAIKQACSYNIEIDVGIRCDIDAIRDQVSPLMVACYFNHLPTIQLLIEHGANLLHLNKEGSSILWYVKSIEACRLIFAEANRQGYLKELLAISNKHDESALYVACKEGHSEIAQMMLADEAFEMKNPIQDLYITRLMHWKLPDKAAAYEEICQAIKKRYLPHGKSPPPKEAIPVSIWDAHSTLFNRMPFKLTPHFTSKESALENAVAEFYALLTDVSKCIPYLKFLNDQLDEYYFTKHKTKLNEPDPESYKFHIVDGLPYPIPNDSYQKLNKHHALQELLILIFKQYGMANDAYKWIGFIPNEMADQSVSRGDFFTENQIGIGLFHNKLTHMLQRTFMLFGIEGGEINVTYVEDGQTKFISPIDILQMIISKKVSGSQNKLWMPIQDARTRSCISFTDPFQLGSFIMHEGFEHGLETLSVYLIDTFCVGYLQLLNAYRERSPFNEMTPTEFANKMNDLKLDYFDMPNYIFQSSIKNEKKHERVIASSGKNYAIVRKEYHPDETFMPKKFGR